jgi:cardiolipin synthase
VNGPGGGSAVDPRDTVDSDTADWACRISERLPAADVHRLAQAALAGERGVRQLRATAGSVILRDACEQLLRRLARTEPLYVSGLLTGAAGAVSRARQHQATSVVWTGPESGVSSSRLTAAAVIDLISEARSEILLVSYATHTEPSIREALSAATARNVAVTLLAERREDNPSYTAAGTPFPGLSVLRLHWPISSRPPGAALHAKIIVVDDRVALVGSANLTSRAMESNIECGILIRGGPQPRAIRDHVAGLYTAGFLLRLRGVGSPIPWGFPGRTGQAAPFAASHRGHWIGSPQ